MRQPWSRSGPAPSPGLFSAVISQPVDTVKANMMGLDRGAYASSLHCARAIVKADGVRALWNGGDSARVVRVFFEVGLQFCSLEASIGRGSNSTRSRRLRANARGRRRTAAKHGKQNG